MALGVSVVIPAWEEAKYLPALFASLRAQTIPPVEVIVADSGSADGTAEVAWAAGATVLPGPRMGPGEGRNRGARFAQGDVLLFVDADCVLPATLLEAAVRALEDRTVVGGTFGFAPTEAGPGLRLVFFLANGYQRAMTIWGFPHNAGYCFFFRREAFERLGGIREDMLLNETHDLALRSRALGRFVILPQTVRTSARRFRRYGYGQTLLREYVASTLVYYLTGRTPGGRFRPKPAR